MLHNKWTALGFGFGLGAGGMLLWLRARRKKEKERRKRIEEMQQLAKSRVAEAQKAAERNDEEKGPDISDYIAKNNLTELVEENNRKRFERERAEYMELLQKNGYSPEPEVELEEPPEDIASHPYVITPHEFGERQGWDTVEYRYFDDGVLADENGDEMTLEEIENTVGKDAVSHFGEYEEDSVYIRNERHRCDYAIYLYEEDYEQFLSTRPQPVLAEGL